MLPKAKAPACAESVMSELGLGRVKTQERAIAIEELIRLRPGLKAMSPCRDRKSETTAHEKWPHFCQRAISCGFRRTARLFCPQGCLDGLGAAGPTLVQRRCPAR